MNPKFLKALRCRLTMTQDELALATSVSAKAIQSYEQGWRRIPATQATQFLILLALYRERDVKHTPCWTVVRCPAKRRKACAAFRISKGRFCWLISGRLCRDVTAKERKGIVSERCLACAVVQRLL
ncbi:MAG: helix-turn-helix domain-containing protein [Kiritimatiellia bacterium]